MLVPPRFAGNPGGSMSRVSTAFVMIAGASVGPWSGDNGWRVGATAQLVEGGGGGSYWETSPSGHQSDGTAPESLVINSLDPRVVAQSLVLLLATTVWNEEVQQALLGTTNVETFEGRRMVANPWKLTAAMTQKLSAALVPEIRLGIVRLDDDCSLDAEAVAHLRTLGFTVDEFLSPVPAAL